MTLARILALLALVPALAGAQEAGRFRDVEIDKPYAPYLLANPLLMDAAGAKVIRLPSGNLLVVGIGATVPKGNTPRDRINAELVCRTKALASVVAEKEGVQVARAEKLEERTVVTIENGTEKARSVSDLLQITRTQVQGIARGLSIVGRWRSADGTTTYVALAAVCDRKGNPLPGEDPK